MLAADIGMTQKAGFFNRKFEDLFGPRGKRYVPKSHQTAADRETLFNFISDFLNRKPHLLEDSNRNTILLTQYGQKEMLSAEIVVAPLFGFFLCVYDYLSSLLRKLFEHLFSP